VRNEPTKRTTKSTTAQRVVAISRVGRGIKTGRLGFFRKALKVTPSRNNVDRFFVLITAVMLALAVHGVTPADEARQGTVQPLVLQSAAFKHYIDAFNANDQELYPGYITNGAAWNFLKDNIPLFECPDHNIEEIYYFRWWTYRKHIKLTPDGFIVSEFLPDVPWAGKDDSIDCAAGHHFYEGRWLADPKYLNDYSVFWFRKGGEPRRYSFWAADSLWSRYLVSGDASLVKELLPDLINNYEAWETSHLGTNGLFWQTDDRDGMEMSIGGSGYRPTINSYLYGDAVAIANIAELAGQFAVAKQYREKAAKLKQLVEDKLWDDRAHFFKVLPQDKNQLVNVRELQGYTPWYFNLPDADKSVAWQQLMDPKGFYAPCGLTTAEQRDPNFAIVYAGHECQWDGPSWPFATSITLTAMANLLDNYRQHLVSRQDYLTLLRIYAKSQHLKLEDGRTVPWIDEDLDPNTGAWIARTLLKQRGSDIPERGKDYNHSTYCNLVITGLVGLRPRADNEVVVVPMVPDGQWNYFCLDNVHYHGHILTILYDQTGDRYYRGKGLRVFSDRKLIAGSNKLGRLTGALFN
jgi:hypothetical protein